MHLLYSWEGFFNRLLKFCLSLAIYSIMFWFGVFFLFTFMVIPRRDGGYFNHTSVTQSPSVHAILKIVL